jgi:hypothetical protein
LALLGVISKTAQQTKGHLRVTKLELTDLQHTGTGGGAPAGGASPSGLLLAGVALDNPAVTELLDGLQDSGLFSHVKLLMCKELENNANSLREYEVRCEF